MTLQLGFLTTQARGLLLLLLLACLLGAGCENGRRGALAGKASPVPPTQASVALETDDVTPSSEEVEEAPAELALQTPLKGKIVEEARFGQSKLKLNTKSIGQKVYQLSFNADGTKVAVDGSRVVVYRYPEFEELQSPEIPYVNALAFHDDMLYLAASDALIRLDKDGSTTTMPGLEERVTAIEPIEGKPLLALAGEKGALIIYDLDGQQEVVRRQFCELTITALTSSKSGKVLAVGGNNGKISFFDTESWETLWSTTIDSRTYSFVELSEKLWLASDEKGRFWRFDLQAKEPELVSQSSESFDPDELYAMAATPAGQRLVACDGEGQVYVWDQEKGSGTKGPKWDDRAVAWRSLSDSSFLAITKSGELHTFDLNETYTPPPPPEDPPTTFDGPLYALAVSPDGQWLVGADSSRILLWSLDAQGQASEPILLDRERCRGEDCDVEYRPALALAFSPDSSLVAASCDDHTTRVWQRADQSLIQSLQLEWYTTSGLDLTFASDNALYFIVADRDLAVWRPGQEASVLIKTAHGDETDAVVVTASHVVTGGIGGEGLTLWDREGKKVGLFGEPEEFNYINAMALSGDQARIACGGAGQPVYVFSVPERELLFRAEPFSPDNEDIGVVALSYGPNDRWLASLHFDQFLRIWSSKGQLLAQHALEVGGRALAVHPTLPIIWVSGATGVVKLRLEEN